MEQVHHHFIQKILAILRKEYRQNLAQLQGAYSSELGPKLELEPLEPELIAWVVVPEVYS